MIKYTIIKSFNFSPFHSFNLGSRISIYSRREIFNLPSPGSIYRCLHNVQSTVASWFSIYRRNYVFSIYRRNRVLSIYRRSSCVPVFSIYRRSCVFSIYRRNSYFQSTVTTVLNQILPSQLCINFSIYRRNCILIYRRNSLLRVWRRLIEMLTRQ